MLNEESRRIAIETAWRECRQDAIQVLGRGLQYPHRIVFFNEGADAAELDEVVMFEPKLYRKTIDVLCEGKLVETLRRPLDGIV